MLLAPGPLLRRELAALSRRRLEHLGRAVGLGLILGFLALVWANEFRWRFRGGALTSQELSSIGRMLLAWTQMGLTGLLALLMPGAMGGAIAGEREERSLDLLRATPLGTFQIVAEKLAARLAYAFHWMVLAGPFFLLPLFFGGVSVEDVAMAFFFPMGAAVWTGSAALVASALARRQLVAILGTFIACIAYHALGGVLLIGVLELKEESFHALPLIGYLVVPVALWEMSGSGALLAFRWALPLETLIFAAACLGVAAWRMGREDGAERSAGDERSAGTGPKGRGAARREIRGNPVAWKESAIEAGSGVRRLLGAGLAVFVSCFLFALAENWRWRREAPAGGMMLAGVLVGVLGLAGAARPRWRRPCWTAAILVAIMGTLVLPILATATDLAACILAGVAVLTFAAYRLLRHRAVLFASAALAVAGVYISAAWRGGWRMESHGGNFFLGSALLLGIFITVATALVAANAVAGERARRTHECLLMTPLTSRQILDGKAAGCGWSLWPGLLVLVALMAMTAAFYRLSLFWGALSVAILGAWLALTIEFGLWMSARFRKVLNAISASIGAQFLYLGVLPLVAMLATGREDAAEDVCVANPGYWFVNAMQYGMRQNIPSRLVREPAELAVYVFVFITGCIALAFLFRKLAAARLDLDRGGSAGSPDAPAGGLRT
jgi:ABC-type Na+ efflux pump permease subunit